jgi:hypothetical protein
MRLRRNNVAAAPQIDTAAFKKWFGKSKVVDAEGKPLILYHGTIKGGFVEFDLGKIDKHHSGFFFTNSKVVAESYGMGNPLPRRTSLIPDIRTISDIRRFVKSPENNFEDGWRIVLGEWQQIIEEDESDDLPYTGMGARVFISFFLYWERNGKTEHIGEDYYYPPYTNLVPDVLEALRRGGPLTSGTYGVYVRMLKPMVVDGKGAPWMSIPYKGGYYKTNQLSAIAKEKGHDGLILRNIYDSSVVQDVISDIYVVFDPHNIKSATANVGTFDRKNADIRKNPRVRRRNPEHPASGLTDERMLRLACVGMCGEFAVALRRVYGYPLAAFFEVGPDGYREGDFTLAHAFAKHPSRKAVDSRGVRTKAEIKAEILTSGGKLEEHAATEEDIDALSVSGLDFDVLSHAEDYVRARPEVYGPTARRQP